MGGCLLGSDMLPWASTMLAFNARPPDPRRSGEAWRDLWLARLDGSPPFVEEWLRHQRRDAYWRHGSVCEDLGAIECAGLRRRRLGRRVSQRDPAAARRARLSAQGADRAVGAHLSGRRAGRARRSASCRRRRWFWDHWLKGEENGVDGRADAAGLMQEPVAAAHVLHGAAGPVGRRADLAVAADRLARGGLRRPVPLVELGTQSTRALAGTFVAWGEPADLPPDQRGEDALCLARRHRRWSTGWRRSASRRWSWTSRSTGRRRSLRCACAMSTPTARRCRSRAAS